MPECIYIDACNITALLSAVFVILFHLDHSDTTFLSSKFILSDSPQDYLWSQYPIFPSLLRSPTFQTIPYCLAKTNLSSWCTTFSLAHSHKFLTQILWCQTVCSLGLSLDPILSLFSLFLPCFCLISKTMTASQVPRLLMTKYLVSTSTSCIC